MSMKTPVWIDLRGASSVLFQFGSAGLGVDDVYVGPGAGGASGPVTPLQIITRASEERANCNWDKEAILS